MVYRTLKARATLIVEKSDFDINIYKVIKNRTGDEKYLSSEELALRLNKEKVVIMKKEQIIHGNFTV